MGCAWPEEIDVQCVHVGLVERGECASEVRLCSGCDDRSDTATEKRCSTASGIGVMTVVYGIERTRPQSPFCIVSSRISVRVLLLQIDMVNKGAGHG
jgi:hypothetical protein